MAAITAGSTTGAPFQLLESIAITNQTAASTTVRKYIAVPAWAKYATFVVDLTAVGGTTPTFDFTIAGVNIADTFPPDDADLFLLGAGWDGITQKTAASTATVHLGPDVTTDDTGSGTADDAYGVGCVLPPILVYSYTTTDAADDADYTATISVYWKGGK